MSSPTAAEGAAVRAQEQGGAVRLADRLEVAGSFAARAAGLLGRTLAEGEGLYIAPCSAIHTFGMSGPIDAVFVDGEGRALALYPDLAPWRATRWIPGARGVVELPAGTLARTGLRRGDRVALPAAGGGTRAGRAAANFVLAVFWLFLAARMLPLLATGRADLSAYLLFGVNTLIGVLFLARRPEKRVTEFPRDRLVTLLCILLSFLLSPAADASLFPAPWWASALMSLSLVLVIAAYLNLGRSFGLIPADRGLKLAGLYGWVRHPLYAGEMLFFGSFLAGNFTWRNLVLLVGIVVSLHLRALAEERLLARDEAYSAYCRRVRARYLPYLV